MDDEDDELLGPQLYRAVGKLRDEIAAAIAPLGLVFPQFVCLRLISASPGSSNAELARDVGVTPQSMNVVLQGMEEAGLVVRPVTVASGRSRPATLTANGRSVLTRAESLARGAEERLLGGLSEAMRRDFREALRIIGRRGAID